MWQDEMSLRPNAEEEEEDFEDEDRELVHKQMTHIKGRNSCVYRVATAGREPRVHIQVTPWSLIAQSSPAVTVSQKKNKKKAKISSNHTSPSSSCERSSTIVPPSPRASFLDQFGEIEYFWNELKETEIGGKRKKAADAAATAKLELKNTF